MISERIATYCSTAERTKLYVLSYICVCMGSMGRTVVKCYMAVFQAFYMGIINGQK